MNLRHISSSETTSKLSQYRAIICSNTGNQASCHKLAAGSKALELGGEPVSERGCLPTKLTDT